MTMCTFAHLKRSGNARRVNCGWTEGDPEEGRKSAGKKADDRICRIPRR